MRPIRFFLGKFRFLEVPQGTVEESIQTILKDDFDIYLHWDDVYFKSPTIFIKITNSVIRNEILIHQEEILKKLQAKIGGDNLKRIQFITSSHLH